MPDVKSENEIPNALDKCLADSLIKLGAGVVTGGVLSLVLFKRRTWPVTLAAGIGLGMGMSNCQHKLNATNVVRRNISGGK